MREKFDFTAEMNEAKTVKSNPHNEFLEEENRLLNLNVKELAKLNDNVHELRTKVENCPNPSRSVNHTFQTKCKIWL